MQSEWKAIVEFDPGMITNSVYLFRDREYRSREYMASNFEIHTVKEGERLDREKIRFAMLDDDQLQALLQAFDKFGVKRPDAGFVEGKLEATEAHLSDMRKLVLKERA